MYLRDIIVPNSPVSDVIRYYLENILDSLGNYADTIRKVQANIYPFRTPTAVSRELNGYINDYQLNLNDYIQYLISSDTLDNDSVNKALNILGNQNTNETKQMLFCTYLADSNLTVAGNMLKDFVPETADEIKWKNLNSILIKYTTGGKTIFDMSPADELFIRGIANDSSCSLAAINAQAVLRLVYGEEFDPCPIPPNNDRTVNNNANNNAVSARADKAGYLGDNIPNPFTNTTMIPYRLPVKWKTASLNILDINGKKLMNIPITNEKGFVILALNNYMQGVYLYSLIIDGNAVQTKRMVLIK